jgi:hypothetical protein
MQHATPSRRRWQPESEADLRMLRDCLENVLATPRFSASKRYPALLKYVVEKTLSGDADSLKERTIGIEVFSRPANYDTNSDTVVRYTAGEVRKRLSLYYHEDGADSPLHIELPSGCYVPEFYLVEVSSKAEYPAPDSHGLPPAVVLGPRHVSRLRRAWTYSLLLIALAATALLLRQSQRKEATVFEKFWAPVFSMKAGDSLLLCPGAVVFSSTEQTGVAVANNDQQDSMISSETGSSIGQLTNLFGTRNVPFLLRLPTAIPSTSVADHSVVLIGAYSNPLSMQSVSNLRYRFSAQPTQSIYDATQPAVLWARPRSWSNKLGNDYGLIARIKNPQTGRYAVVLAGLGHSGTEAATTFVTSPTLMNTLSTRLPPDWAEENLEIVIRTEVREAKSTDPTIEAIWVGK